MAEKIVLLEKMSKKQRKEFLKKNRVMFGHQQCPVAHKSAKDKNRRREKEVLASLRRDWRVFDCSFTKKEEKTHIESSPLVL